MRVAKSIRRTGGRLLRAALAVIALATPAAAQIASRPFSVAGSEGGGPATGIGGWLLEKQSQLTHLMSGDIHRLQGDPHAIWALVGLGLVYGVFHAAGPGHGKALIASYMLANERSLRRGALLSLLAAMLQGVVAIALVGAAAFVFSATALDMNRAAEGMELASYCAIAVVGAWLVWRKGAAFFRAAAAFAERRVAITTAPLSAAVAWRSPSPTFRSRRFAAIAGDDASPAESFEEECGHMHAPDPAQLGDAFSWRSAFGTVVAAGVRPCSGAVLVLVFSLSQGLFAAGVAATFAMALGTAVTTASLAALAVFAKGVALRLAAGEDSRVALLARLFEFAAALAVLAFGVALLLGARGGGA